MFDKNDASHNGSGATSRDASKNRMVRRATLLPRVEEGPQSETEQTVTNPRPNMVPGSEAARRVGTLPRPDAAGEAAAAPRTVAASEEEDLEAQLAYQNLKRKREARKRKRIIVISLLVVAALVAAIVFISGQVNKEEDDSDFDMFAATTEVYRGEFSTSVTANGATEPLSSTVVTPEVDGIIEGLSIVEGSVVNEGDVLFTLKNDALDKAVREAEAQLDSARRASDTANTAVDNAYAAYNRAWSAANEADDWENFDEAGLREAIAASEDAYRDALSGVDTAQAALDEARAQADKRIVRAPVSGSVVALNAQNGAGVGSESGGSSSGSGPLVQIADLHQMKVTVQVNEVDISNIQEGQTATATFSALPDVSLNATVQRIASVSSGSSEGGDYGGGVVTYAVDLLIPEPDSKLKPGMTATVTIVTESVPDALIIPASALQGAEGGWYVTIVDDAEKGQTHDAAITVVAKNNSDAAIEGPLKEGDQILMGGSGGGGADEDDMAMDMYMEY
ncbi:MAG: efflux RND transporter periplasmic adaptor subunit [Atopobiaceae bacterium]|nr:efflux RND transporter periplasmic adaptor subunit [Atopobiaceae bacterium]